MKLTLILNLLLLFAATSAAAYDFEVDGIYYSYCNDQGSVEVTDSPYPNRYSGAVNIPEAVTYNGITYAVTAIGNYAFSSCDNLMSVTMPNSVITIGEHAFESYNSLTRLTVGNAVTTFGNFAFAGCDGLTSMIIPNSVTSIGDYVFYRCDTGRWQQYCC